MKPITFPEATRELKRPESMTDEECSPLPIHDDGQALTSCWQPDDAERRALAAGAPLWLRVLGRGHPPVSLGMACPFERPADATAGVNCACGAEKLPGAAYGHGTTSCRIGERWVDRAVFALPPLELVKRGLANLDQAEVFSEQLAASKRHAENLEERLTKAMQEGAEWRAAAVAQAALVVRSAS